MPPREIKKTTIKYESSFQPQIQSTEIQDTLKRNLE
jgi:hypothetical protein